MVWKSIPMFSESLIFTIKSISTIYKWFCHRTACSKWFLVFFDFDNKSIFPLLFSDFRDPGAPDLGKIPKKKIFWGKFSHFSFRKYIDLIYYVDYFLSYWSFEISIFEGVTCWSTVLIFRGDRFGKSFVIFLMFNHFTSFFLQMKA